MPGGDFSSFEARYSFLPRLRGPYFGYFLFTFSNFVLIFGLNLCIRKGWFSLATESVVGVVIRKPRAIRSSENQTDGVGSRTLIPLMTPSLTIS